MHKIVLILHDIRSCHNVGSLLRTAEGLGVNMVYFTGYTPYPSQKDDSRLPHIHQKLTKQISKTALGAEVTQAWQTRPAIENLLTELKSSGYMLCALEQSDTSQALQSFNTRGDIALLLGREVEGLDPQLLKAMDVVLEIPMSGSKESFNVVQAAAMALYQFKFH